MVHLWLDTIFFLFVCFRLSFQEGLDRSHKGFSDRATVSAIIGSKSDKFEERTCKRSSMVEGDKGMVFSMETLFSFQRQ